ncbi:MAG: signal recognition particle-docking protein FtsY [Halobacteriaceae archaeon]
MFDSLKDTFGKFTSDVAEEAEEPEEGAAEAPADETADAAGAADEGADAGASEPTGADEPGTDEESGRGLGERAKAFATGRTFIEAEDLEGPLEELELALLASDVELSVVESILEELREELTGETRAQVHSTRQVVEEALHDALLEVIAVGQFDFDAHVRDAEKPVVIVFTGVNGVGKTTTIAKLSRYLEERGLSSVWANGDTYRAGANQQIAEHADALGERVITHEQGSDPAAVIYDAVEYAEANDVDVVLGDTAGRLHTSNDLMAQLEKIDRVVEPDLTLFVDEAVAGQDAVNRAREFDAAASVDGVVLTKADADSDGGAAISIAHVIGEPILFLGTGQGYDDLERFDPEELVGALLGGEE